MILILLALLVSVTALPDYYAIHIQGEKFFKIFTKISECTGVVYRSGHNRVLFQDGVWKIGTLKNDLDCNRLSSVVEEEFRTKSPRERPELIYWYDMNDDQILLWIEHLNKREKKTYVKLVGGTMLDDKSEEDCFTEDWGTRFPDKDIVVAFQDSNCFYDFVDRAQLTFSSRYRSATVFGHLAGKNINNQLRLQL